MKYRHLIIMLMLIPMGLAYNSGDPICITIDNCKDWVDLHVNGELPIDSAECWFDGCLSIMNDTWRCYCSSPTMSFTMHTSARTLNSYNITASYELADQPAPISGSSNSGGGGGGRRNVYIINQTAGECEVCDVPQPINDTVHEPIIPEPYWNGTSNNVTEPAEVKQVPTLKLPTYFWTGIIIIALLVAALLTYIFWENKKGKGDANA